MTTLEIMDARGYSLHLEDFDLPSFSSQALSQVKDSHYQRNLRTIRQVQRKRARLLKNLDKNNCPTKNETYTSADESNKQEIFWRHSKNPCHSVPSPLRLTPLDQECNIAQPVVPRPLGVARPVQFPHRETAIPKAFLSHLNKGLDYPSRPMTGFTSIETPGVSQHIIRPTPRYINVVRTVQQHGHEAHTHPKLPATSGSSRLPLKKRKYVADSDGPEPIAKALKTSYRNGENSAFYNFLPSRVMDEYFLEHHKHEEQEMTAEDKEVADIMEHEIKDTLASEMIEQSNLDAEIDEAKMFLKRDVNEVSQGLALSEVDSQVRSTDEAHYLFRSICSEIISNKSTGNSSFDTPKPRKSATIPSTTGPGVDVQALVRNMIDDSDFSRNVCSHHRQQMVEIMVLLKGYLSSYVSLTSDSDDDDLFGGDQRVADTECQGNYGDNYREILTN